jgi:cyclopropane fatty-acyl-phospholipid synthase-like methyltransferase
LGTGCGSSRHRESQAEGSWKGSESEFQLGDALHLERLKQKFDTVTDCGLFHTFSDEERSFLVKSLKAALNESGTYFMLCFSSKESTG